MLHIYYTIVFKGGAYRDEDETKNGSKTVGKTGTKRRKVQNVKRLFERFLKAGFE